MPRVTIPAPPASSPSLVPAYALYGEQLSFPDVLHSETLGDRAPLHDWVIRPHRHNRLHQIFLILHGGGTFGIDARTVALAPPMVINVPRGAVHGFRFDQGAQGFVLTIPITELAEPFTPGGWLAGVLERGFAEPAADVLAPMFIALQNEFSANRPARATLLRALATQIVCAVARIGAETAPPAAEVASPNPHMTRFSDLVDRHVRTGWRVADYADALGVSPTHLNRVCQSATGTSAQRFIEGRLFQEACRLIAYTMQDIAAIGYNLGFDDPSYFSRAFRRNVGMTPSEYRAKLER